MIWEGRPEKIFIQKGCRKLKKVWGSLVYTVIDPVVENDFQKLAESKVVVVLMREVNIIIIWIFMFIVKI